MILVSGLVNLETTAKVDGFPIHYSPVRYPFFGVNSTVSGVGYNVAKALLTLGNDIQFLTLLGEDIAGQFALQEFENLGIDTSNILQVLDATPQSVILYDDSGQRQINVDLKSIQETAYPAERFEAALEQCDLAVLCNINFTRPFLARAREMGKLVATDVHSLSNVEDEYNRDYMANANILFLSHENLPASPYDFAQQLIDTFNNDIVVIGLGADGALMAVREDNSVEVYPAVYSRPVVNTIGAGDALFSAFTHEYHRHGNPYLAIRKAIVFASYKIGEAGAAQGFLTADALTRLYEEFA